MGGNPADSVASAQLRLRRRALGRGAALITGLITGLVGAPIGALAGPAAAGGRDPVRQAGEALLLWRRDWENRDFDRFAAHHAEGFRANGLDRSSFLERKRSIFEKRPWHRIRLTEVLWLVEQNAPDTLTVRFGQEYESPQGTERTRKEQRWIRVGERWQLASEREMTAAESDPARATPAR